MGKPTDGYGVVVAVAVFCVDLLVVFWERTDLCRGALLRNEDSNTPRELDWTAFCPVLDFWFWSRDVAMPVLWLSILAMFDCWRRVKDEAAVFVVRIAIGS